MDKFQQYFHNIFPELSSFSFALIPDQLQAHQIVLDGISAFLLEEKQLIESLLSDEGELMDFHHFRIRITLHKLIYMLAAKRSPQLENSISSGEDKAAFCVLELQQRGVLFLKHKTRFEFNEIQEILERTNGEVISHLQLAREHFIDNLGLKELN